MEGRIVAVVALALVAGFALSHPHHHFVCASDWDRDALRMEKMQWQREARLAKAELRTQRILMHDQLRAQTNEMRAQLRADRDRLREDMRTRREEARERARGWMD